MERMERMPCWQTHHGLHEYSKLAVATHELLQATYKLLLATHKLLRNTARCRSATAPQSAQVIRYTATAEGNCGWCSSAPGVHPQYHAHSLKWQCARGSLNFLPCEVPSRYDPSVSPKGDLGERYGPTVRKQNTRKSLNPVCPRWTVEGV